MSYKALYRKYRPQLFSEVVSQAAIIQTLQNAIISGKISHAYLFSGPRGTGKTTVARIFAKALNCENPINGEPCCECNNCHEISEAISPDVIEIDAASNNGVDEIRDIREKVKFLPSGAKYKIYIIDEVHMLSQGAFNALLKTLEEPPKHVVFILATTEPQKLPATIISRCQRFDFKPINALDISVRLKNIAEKEDSSISDEAINAISEAADGGMRDALSILDQVISYGNKNITIEDVNTITGSISFDKMIELMNYIESKNVNFALESVNDFINTGKEAGKIINTMLIFCRDLLLYKNIGDKNSNKYIFEKEKFQELANKLQSNKILYYIDLLCDVQNKIKMSTTPNIYMEITIIKMCTIVDSDLDLMGRINTLEEKVNNGDFTSNGEGGSIDSEKLSIVDAKVNRVVTELNKLELHKISPRIDELEQRIENNSSVNNGSSDLSFKKEIEDIKFDIENLKNDALVNNSSDSNSSVNSEKYDELQEQINELKEQKQGKPIIPDDINFSIESIKQDLYELKNEFENNKGQVDLEPVNNRLQELEDKINNAQPIVQSEENNIDLSSVNEQISLLKEQLENLKNQPKASNNEGTNSVELADLSETVEILKMEYEDLKNASKADFKAENPELNNQAELNDKYNELLQKINELASKVDSIDNSNVSYKTVNDNTDDQSDLAEIKEKIQTLESRMYKFISESISTSSKAKVKPEKKPNGQIMLFGDDIIGVDDIEKQSKETVDFGDLTKDEDEIKIDNEINKEGYVQESLSLNDEEKTIDNVVTENNDIGLESDTTSNTNIEIETVVNDVPEETNEVSEESQTETVQETNESLFNPKNSEKVEEEPVEDNKQPEVETPKENNLFAFNFTKKEDKKAENYSYDGELFNFGSNSEKENIEQPKVEVKVEPIVEKPVEKEKVKDVIIEQHYDANKQESVVTKTNSMLVTKDKQNKTDEDISIEKSLLMHEKENVVEDKKPEQQAPEIIVGKHEEVSDKFINYDVKDIEQILFDSQSAECRGDRVRIKELWPTIARGVSPDLIPIVNTLSRGQIKVVGNKELIITYADVSYCNQVMRPKFKREALRILYSKLGDTYNYIALTDKVWDEKSQEYKNQYYMGIKKPKLTPLVIPGLNIIDDSEEYKSKDDEMVNKVIEFFGSDIVKDRR